MDTMKLPSRPGVPFNALSTIPLTQAWLAILRINAVMMVICSSPTPTTCYAPTCLSPPAFDCPLFFQGEC